MKKFQKEFDKIKNDELSSELLTVKQIIKR